MSKSTSPRIYCIPATGAGIVAVLRRGPARWAHVGCWNTDTGLYEPGAWLSGRLFPRRCDLSADGRLLSCFVHKPGASWEHGETYVAVSRLPWLTALHAFGTCGTWTRGYRFADAAAPAAPGQVPLPHALRLHPIPVVQFAIERSRGWEEAADSPPRVPGDTWDQHRNARMSKPQPGGTRLLCVESEGWAGGEFGAEQAVDGMRVRYSLEDDGDLEPLDGIQWADWDRHGRLLVATRSGKLQVRDLDAPAAHAVFEEDLSHLVPDPVPAPDWARRW